MPIRVIGIKGERNKKIKGNTMARQAKTTATKTTKKRQTTTNPNKVLRDSAKRLRTHRMEGKLLDAKKSDDYKNLLNEIKKSEKAKDRLEQSIQKKLDPIIENLKIELGIYDIEDKIYELDTALDSLYADKIRFEDLVIENVSSGKKVKDFEVKRAPKGFYVSYKSICDEEFAGRQDEYDDAKERHGSRKVQLVLIFNGEEVAKRKLDE